MYIVYALFDIFRNNNLNILGKIQIFLTLDWSNKKVCLILYPMLEFIYIVFIICISLFMLYYYILLSKS